LATTEVVVAVVAALPWGVAATTNKLIKPVFLLNSTKDRGDLMIEGMKRIRHCWLIN